MNSDLNLEKIKSLIDKLPVTEQTELYHFLKEKLEGLNWMKLAETGFSDWDDDEENIY